MIKAPQSLSVNISSCEYYPSACIWQWFCVLIPLLCRNLWSLVKYPGLLLPTPEITFPPQVPDPLKNQELILWMRTVWSGKIIPLAGQGKPRDQTEPLEEITVTLFPIITPLSQLPMDHETIYWALPTGVGWGLWLFLICFLESHLLQFLVLICKLEIFMCNQAPVAWVGSLFSAPLRSPAESVSSDLWGIGATQNPSPGTAALSLPNLLRRPSAVMGILQ